MFVNSLMAVLALMIVVGVIYTLNMVVNMPLASLVLVLALGELAYYRVYILGK